MRSIMGETDVWKCLQKVSLPLFFFLKPFLWHSEATGSWNIIYFPYSYRAILLPFICANNYCNMTSRYLVTVYNLQFIFPHQKCYFLLFFLCRYYIRSKVQYCCSDDFVHFPSNSFEQMDDLSESVRTYWLCIGKPK